MLKQFPVVELLDAVLKRLRANGLSAHDHIPKDSPSPLVSVEMIRSQPANTKTMYVTQYDIQIRAIAPAIESSIPIFDLVRQVEEAMTRDIDIPEPYNLIRQAYSGINSTYTDEAGERHAVMNFSFYISYGFMCKN